jgi:hypothetical protein
VSEGCASIVAWMLSLKKLLEPDGWRNRMAPLESTAEAAVGWRHSLRPVRSAMEIGPPASDASTRREVFVRAGLRIVKTFRKVK